MKVIVQFINGNDFWQNLVIKNAVLVSQVLSHPDFIKRVAAWPAFDFTNQTALDVSETIDHAGEVKIRVGFYKGWFFSKAIAYEENGAIHFNTRKLAYGAGGVGNIAHELMHALGFSHQGNSPRGNENTVPWRIGQWVAQWLESADIVSNAMHAREVAEWDAQIARKRAEAVT